MHRLLQAREIEVYFPALRVEPKNPRAAKVRPFFPGYMFVHIDLEEAGENALRWLPGTYGLVRFGGEPAIVSPDLIGRLKKQLAAIQAKGTEPEKELRKGDRVKIMEGPFAGYEAIFDIHLSGKERVQILLTYLNSQAHRITLNADSVEKL